MSGEKEFGADPDLKQLYRVYLVIALVGGFLSWMIPVVTFVTLSSVEIGVVVALALFVPIMIVVGFVLYWIPRFYSSISYVLGDDDITVTKGVWWKMKSLVPYNRITNVNIYQGPISRHFGLGRLSIQTAGFSGASGGGRVAEAVILGIKNFEEVKDTVIGFVKGIGPEAVEAAAGPSQDVNRQILAELRRMRKTLEK